MKLIKNIWLKIDDGLNKKMDLFQINDTIVIQNTIELEKIIEGIEFHNNLEILKKEDNIIDYQYRGENYSRFTGALERVKILNNEISRHNEYSYFRFRCKFTLDKMNSKLLISVYEYGKSTAEIEKKFFTIMSEFRHQVVRQVSENNVM